MKIVLKNGCIVDAEVIKNIASFRGFYAILNDGSYVKNSFNSAGFRTGYKRGYNTNELSVFEHLYNKLENKEKLSKYEKLDFYEKIKLNNPTAQTMGEWFYFSEVLNKVFGINFYTLDKKITKKEIKIFYESGDNDNIDIEALAKIDA